MIFKSPPSLDEVQQLLNSNEYEEIIKRVCVSLPSLERKRPLSLNTAQMYRVLGNTFLLLGDFQSALLTGFVSTAILNVPGRRKSDIPWQIRFAERFMGAHKGLTKFGYSSAYYELELLTATKSNLYILDTLGYHRIVKPCLERMLEYWEKISPLDDGTYRIHIADAHRLLFSQYVYFKELDNATAMLEKLRISNTEQNIEYKTGELRLAQGDTRQAKQHFLNAYRFENSTTTNKLRECLYFNDLVEVCIANQEYDEALKYVEKMNVILSGITRLGAYFLAFPHQRSGDIYFALKQLDKAEKAYISNIELLQKAFVPDLVQSKNAPMFFHKVVDISIKNSQIHYTTDEIEKTLRELCYHPQHPRLLEAYQSLEKLYKETNQLDRLMVLTKKKAIQAESNFNEELVISLLG